MFVRLLKSDSYKVELGLWVLVVCLAGGRIFVVGDGTCIVLTAVGGGVLIRYD